MRTFVITPLLSVPSLLSPAAREIGPFVRGRRHSLASYHRCYTVAGPSFRAQGVGGAFAAVREAAANAAPSDAKAQGRMLCRQKMLKGWLCCGWRRSGARHPNRCPGIDPRDARRSD